MSYHQFSSGSRCIPLEYQKSIPETKDIYWNDDFFEEEEGVIAVFDFDYQQMEDYQFKVDALSQPIHIILLAVYFSVVFGALYAIPVAFCLLLFSLTLLRYQIQWQTRANHLAITRDGIRSVQDKRKTCLGWSMCDRGKHSKTVPFDMITDCDIVEPAGNASCIVPRVLYTVKVDTASSGGERHELQIVGLKNPHKFKALVWAMKRQRNNNLLGGAVAGSEYKAPPAQVEMVERNQRLSDGPQNGDVTILLRDIRDELRQNNELLRKIHDSPAKLSNPSDTQGELV